MPMLTDQRPLTWQDVLDDPSLHNLPYKIELNKRGRIEMSPATNLHNMMQMAISDLLKEHAPHGQRFQECSIETSDNVKVADVVWFTPEFLARHGRVTPYTTAPEICVEIVSPSNSKTEVLEKIELYLERGAQEVWTCDLNGQVQFFGTSGALEHSVLVPDFPITVTLEP